MSLDCDYATALSIAGSMERQSAYYSSGGFDRMAVIYSHAARCIRAVAKLEEYSQKSETALGWRVDTPAFGIYIDDQTDNGHETFLHAVEAMDGDPFVAKGGEK